MSASTLPPIAITAAQPTALIPLLANVAFGLNPARNPFLAGESPAAAAPAAAAPIPNEFLIPLTIKLGAKNAAIAEPHDTKSLFVKGSSIPIRSTFSCQADSSSSLFGNAFLRRLSTTPYTKPANAPFLPKIDPNTVVFKMSLKVTESSSDNSSPVNFSKPF